MLCNAAVVQEIGITPGEDETRGWRAFIAGNALDPLDNFSASAASTLHTNLFEMIFNIY